jgi:CRISPR-associated protein Csx14
VPLPGFFEERMANQQQQILITTLSSEPQGVTRVLDWLLAQGYPIGEVVVVHTTGAVIQPALAAVASEFASGFYPGIRYRHVVLTGAAGPVADIRSADDTAALLQTLYQVMRRARRSNRPIHLSITSGRKTMAVYGMVAAQLLFTEQDHVWHMMAIDESGVIDKRLHAGSDEMMEMVEVPVLRWADAATAAALLEMNDPWAALQRQRALTQGDEARRVKEFLERWLTKRERELTLLLVRTGLDNAGLARQLGKREQTVANQLTAVYRRFEEWRGFSSGSSGTRARLVAVLRPFVGEG